MPKWWEKGSGPMMEAYWNKWRYPEASRFITNLEAKSKGVSEIKIAKLINYLFIAVKTTLPIEEIKKMANESIHMTHSVDIIDHDKLFIVIKDYTRKGEKLKYECTFYLDTIAEETKVELDVEYYDARVNFCTLIETLLGKYVTIKNITYRLKA